MDNEYEVSRRVLGFEICKFYVWRINPADNK